MVLKLRFDNLCRNTTIPNVPFNAESIYQDLLQHYEMPYRHYHNLSHLNHCMQEFCQVEDLIPDPASVEMALWFHDVIYIPGNFDNEEKSVSFFLSQIGGALSPSFAKKVTRLILSTTHKELSKDEDERFITDIDLSSLGLSWENFKKDSQNLREERKDMADTVYYKANTKFLKHLLGRGRIFQTAFFYQRYEQIAIQNINRLLKLRESDEPN